MQFNMIRAKHSHRHPVFAARAARVPGCVALALGALLWGTTGTTVLGQTNFQRILSFGPEQWQGSSPRGQLLEASDGMLYGTTYQGGSNNLGTVFRVAKNGSAFGVLHAFGYSVFPFSGLVEGSDGALYGTTSGGGAHNGGTVFKLNKDGFGFTTLKDFSPEAGEGSVPIGMLLKATDGKFYGTTTGGGSNNFGTIFRLNSDGGAFETVYHFRGTNGSYPVAGVIQGEDGLLYGVARNGGASDLGTIFRIRPDGSNYTVLREFLGHGQNDGSLPLGNLVQASDHFLYGTTYSGGYLNDSGTVFRVSTNGAGYSVLRMFGVGGSAEGTVPTAGLVEGAPGRLYGTATHGGTNDGGVAFTMKLDGTGFAVLHSFSGTGGDGSQPFGALLKASDGALYGSTYFGGDSSTNGVSGILFRLSTDSTPVRITSITTSPAAALLTFEGGIAGRPYDVQATAGLGSTGWQTIGTVAAGIDGRFQYTDLGVSSHVVRFY
ncbi:MAG TPA: choice-of-anchor tandem repeat GloVer-containing protein, partial [Verrucomicrobiae bacterium]